MSINKNGKNVKYVRKDKNLAQDDRIGLSLDSSRLSNVLKPVNKELKPELISWNEPILVTPETLIGDSKSKYFHYLVLIIGLMLSGSFFFIGRISKDSIVSDPLGVSYINEVVDHSLTANVVSSQKGPVEVNKSKQPATQKVVPTPNTTGEVIGSKSGKKYYFPWCGTVKRIKPENQIHFVNIEAAKAAGFTPGGNCKGIY